MTLKVLNVVYVRPFLPRPLFPFLDHFTTTVITVSRKSRINYDARYIRL